MDPHSEFDMEEMEELAENMGRNRQQAGNGTFFRNKIVVVMGVVVLVVVFVLLFRGGNNTIHEEVAAITERMNRLEQKQQVYEEFVKNTSDFTAQLTALETSVSQLQSRNESMDEELGRITKQLVLLNDKIVSVSKKTGVSSPPQNKTASPTQRQYHQVKSGDTLYGISKRYGVSVDELRNLNHLSKNAAIHPGQKIIVK